MRLVEYVPGLFDLLRPAAEALGVTSLCHRPFVNYYYGDNPWCKLHLLTPADGAVAGMMGIDRMRFAADGRFIDFAFATNFHAARPGAGGILFLHWMKNSSHGLVFGGSDDTHKILRQQRWTYFPGVKTLVRNRAYHARPGEALWRRWAKRALTGLTRFPTSDLLRGLPPGVTGRVTVREETSFTDDMLPRTSPFTFRFAPSADYLNWRYRAGLSFVRYRIFSIRSGGGLAGYVVLNDSPGKVVVAQCDGEDAVSLAYGVLLSLAEATAADAHVREVMLTASHADMLAVYRRFGFRVAGADRPFAVGSRRGPVQLPRDVSRWLVNFDWGDNGLRAPFADQAGCGPPRDAAARNAAVRTA